MRDLRLGVRTLAWCSILTSVAITVAGCSSDTDEPGGGAGAGTSAGTAGTSATGGTAGGGAGGTGATAGGGAGGGSAGKGGTGGGGAGGSTGGGGAGGSTGGGGGAGGSTGGGGAGGGGGSGGGGTFALTSPNHTEGAAFADKYTCAAAGFNGSLQPELNWTAGPAGTMSYAITFIDTTLTTMQPPNNNGYHWVIYNIPATVTSLPEEFKMASSIGAMANSDYLGPCPNFGGGGSQTHDYEFKIYALETATITVTGTGTAAVKDAEAKLEADNLASATLGGTSDASPP